MNPKIVKGCQEHADDCTLCKADCMRWKITKGTFFGMGVTGTIGGLIGSFLGQPGYIIGMAAAGALLGLVIGFFGEQTFFLFVVVGALLGGLLAIYIGGTPMAIIGLGTGGAIGGFLSVNIMMFRHRS